MALSAATVQRSPYGPLIPGQSTPVIEPKAAPKVLSTSGPITPAVAMPMELALMPVRCWSCNTLMYQIQIENGLKQGKTIQQVMDELKYRKLCCRRTVTTAVPIVGLQKQLEQEKRVLSQLNQLSVVDTGVPVLPLNTTSSMAEGVSRGRVQLGGNIQILDTAPPGAAMVQQYTSFVVPNLTEAGAVQTEESTVNPFEYFMEQLGQTNTGEEGDDY